MALVGTVVASQAEWSRASLSTGPDRGSTRVYRIGDELPDGSRLISIRADRVVLSRDGGKRTLLLQERTPGPASPEKDLPEPKDEDPANTLIKPAGPGRYNVDREQMLSLLEKSSELARDVRVSLAFAPDGGVSGLRLNMLNTGTVFEKLDILDGDTIHRIGSLIIDSPEKIEELPDLLKNVKEVDVELTRDGEMKNLRYFLD